MRNPWDVRVHGLFYAFCLYAFAGVVATSVSPSSTPLSRQSCPRDMREVESLGRICLKQCDSDADCKSKRKRCLCDGVCGLSCIKPDTQCGTLTSPDHGQVRILGGYFGARAYYECDSGYRLIGADQRVCQADGTWSTLEPECRKKIYCESPPNVHNAEHNASKHIPQFEVNTTLKYTCLTGHKPIGFTDAKCMLYNGTALWLGPDLECRPVSCGDPGFILNGYREAEAFHYNSRVTYYCMVGFEIRGRAVRTCMKNGLWSDLLPTCVAVRCPLLENPLHGRALYDSTTYNSVVRYKCQDGYMLIGNSERRCRADKQWSGEKPYCKGVPPTSNTSEIDCGHPGPFYNGWLHGINNTVQGSVIHFRCYKEMKFEGVAKFTTCQENGSWSNPLPKCLAPCVAPEIENGQIRGHAAGDRITHGLEIVVECNTAYEMTYNITPAVCHNGTWTLVPKCTPARCKKLPPRPKHGMVIAPKMDHGMKAKFKCKDGYILKGSNVTECHFGEWTGTTPYCQEVYCPFPGNIKYGKVLLVGNMGLYDYRHYVRKVTNNRQIMFECNKGYTLVDGPPGATCIGGRWSPKQLPRCILGQHPLLRWYRRRRREVAPTSLSAGIANYVTTNRLQRRKVKGKRKPRGNRTPCAPLPDVPYMRVQILRLGKGNESMMPHGTKIEVTCSRGYGLNIANSTAKCIRGRWKPRTPECVTLPCKVPYGQNGLYHHRDEMVREGKELAHGEMLSFSCLAGFQLQGSDSMRCWFGEWAVDTLPKCTPGPCELPHITNGQYMAGYRAGLTIAHGSTIEYECEREYVKTTLRAITCHLGELKPRVPACRHQMVQVIPALGKAGMQETDVHINASGSDISVIDFPVKFRRSCTPPERIQNALIYKEGAPLGENDRRFPDTTEVHFNCITGITGESTSWKIVCEDGTWIGMPHRCETGDLQEDFEYLRNKSCIYRNTEPNLVTFHADMKVTDEIAEFPPGAELVSRCADIGKYALIGSVRRRCINGEWDGVKPACFGLSQENDYALEKPPTILFRHQLGPIAQSNDGKLIVYPGTILHLECLWLRKYGMPQWKVTHSYRKYPEGWTTEPGRDSQLEYRLSIYHAQRDDSGMYTCTTPMGHRHSVEIVVQAVHCPRLPERLGLHISSPSNKMNTKVVFSCKNGNALIGPEQATCLPSGNWSAPAPICENVRCPNQIETHDPSLRVQILSQEVGGRAVFSCIQGHGLRGPAESFCESSGLWSRPIPRCEGLNPPDEVHCNPPPAPDNGYAQGSGVYKGGEVVQFGCNQGYMMEGQPIIVCQENGRWSGPTPKCVQACTYPGTTVGGTISTVKFYYSIGDMVTFDCAKGLQLRGARMLRCQPNGKWSNAIPLCVPADS